MTFVSFPIQEVTVPSNQNEFHAMLNLLVSEDHAKLKHRLVYDKNIPVLVGLFVILIKRHFE